MCLKVESNAFASNSGLTLQFWREQVMAYPPQGVTQPVRATLFFLSLLFPVGVGAVVRNASESPVECN